MKIMVEKLKDDAKLPTHGSDQAAGYDLYAHLTELTIRPHTTEFVPTGIAVAIPEGFFGAIYARSGLSIKQGLRPGNCVGVIDSDYRGQIMVGLHNDFDEPKTVHGGDRIAQLVIQKCEEVEFEEVRELGDTARGQGGFGSTGSN